MAAKIKALQQWCKLQCDGYHDVNITNMTSSWKNGLAFCAIIHPFRPDLIDFESLSKENVFENNKLAFKTAESLGIDALLDAEDMVAMPVPDKLCIVTYVSQYYNHFRCCQPVGGPNVSVAVKRSANTAAHGVVKRPVVESVTHNSLQENAGSRRNTWQDQCSVCHKKVYLMERHMSNNRLYHRQCFRRHERAGTLTVNSAGSQSANSTDNMKLDVASDDTATSSFMSVPSSKHRDSPSPTAVSRIDCTSSSTLAAVPDSSAVVTEEQISAKQSVNLQKDAVNGTAVKSISQLNNAAVDISLHDTSTSAHQQTDLSVLRGSEKVASQPSSTVSEMTRILPCAVVSDDVSLPADELVLHSAYSVGVTPNAMESSVNDKSKTSEQLQNKVDSETSEKTLPVKSGKTLSIPASVSESSSSSSVVVAMENVSESSATKDKVIPGHAPVSPMSRYQAPVDTDVTTAQQPTFHSPSVDVCPASSPLSSAPEAVKLPSESVSSSAHDVSSTVPLCAVSARSSSEFSCTAAPHTVKESHRIIPRRPAPLPPVEIHETKSSQHQSPVTLTASGQIANTTASEPSELSHQQASGEHRLQSEVHAEQQSCKEAVNKQCEEQIAFEASRSHPVPVPRRPRTPKQVVPPLTHVEMCTSSLSPPAGPVVLKTASDNETVTVKLPPVPKPRKSVMCVIEADEVTDKGGPDMVLMHGDTELHKADSSLAAESNTNETVITDSCMSAAANEEPAKKAPTAAARSSQIGAVSSSPLTCEENKSPSFSPTLPVKFPRSKKHRAAPLPPAPVSPESEATIATKPEPQTFGSPKHSAAAAGISSRVSNRDAGTSPGPSASPSSQVTNKSGDKPLLTANSEPTRRKITPGVKFTFEKDVFRAPKTAATVDMPASEHLKPSRPAPPRPAVVTVIKRKVSTEDRLPVDYIKQRLAVLEGEIKKVEQDGCHMEDRIRSLSDDDSDVMMSEWLDMVQKKNELVREESDLIYRQRQQELEDRHSQVEHELRHLMAIPEDKKTAAQKSREGDLLQQLLATVHRRNNIVDSMEEDRKRYLAEDEEISQMKAMQGIDRKKKAG